MIYVQVGAPAHRTGGPVGAVGEADISHSVADDYVIHRQHSLPWHCYDHDSRAAVSGDR